MGWQDDPIVTDSPAPPIQPGTPPPPEGAAPAWSSDPVVSEPAQPQQPPVPSMGAVAANAIPKGLANLLNTPVTLSNLIMQGIANLPYAGHLTGLQDAAKNPELKTNGPMEMMRDIGLVKPEREPQTGPQRIVDMAIQTAIGAAAVPAGGLAGAAQGAAVGAASGAAAQTTKELTGSDLLAAAVGMATPFAIKALTDSSKQLLMTPTKKQTLADARAAGYVVEPSSVRTPSSKLETVAGKASIAQEAAVRNQETTNKLAAKALGLPEDTPMSMDLLDNVRAKAAVPYQEIEKLRGSNQANMPWFPRYHSASLLDELKQARADRTALYRQYDRAGDPALLKAAKAMDSTVSSLETDIENVAKAAGKPELVPQLKAARELYARTYDIERALNLGDGNISAPIIGRMLDQGRPLTGELAIIGRFAQAFPRVAREVASVPPPAVSGTDAAASALLGAGGAAAAGSPAGVIAGGLPLLRGPARRKVLSESYQNTLAQPPKPPTPTGRTAARSAMAGKAVIDSAAE